MLKLFTSFKAKKKEKEKNGRKKQWGISEFRGLY